MDCPGQERRRSPDEWIARILADASDLTERDRLRAPVEALQWDVAARALVLGIDVILEWGFWARRERQDYRARVEVRFLEVSREALWEWLSRRNAALPPGTFAVTQEQLDLWWSWFEPPSSEEVTLTKVT